MKARPSEMIAKTALLPILALALVAASPGDLHHGSASTSHGTRSVNGSCQAIAGAYTDLNTMTFGIRAHAEAEDSQWGHYFVLDVPRPARPYSQSAGPPPDQAVREVAGTATSVTCLIRDAATDEIYGRVAAGQPGPLATAVGTVEIPSDAYVRAEVCVTALYLDGERLHSCE